MTCPDSDPATVPAPRADGDPSQPAGKPIPRGARPISMHEGIAVWCDCCSCKIEPYWAEVAEEMGVDLGSDYEDDSVGRDLSAPGRPSTQFERDRCTVTGRR